MRKGGDKKLACGPATSYRGIEWVSTRAKYCKEDVHTNAYYLDPVCIQIGKAGKITWCFK